MCVRKRRLAESDLKLEAQAMTDPDPIELAMQEIRRTVQRSESPAPIPLRSSRPPTLPAQILSRKSQAKLNLTRRRRLQACHATPPSPAMDAPRDIDRKRTKLSPVSPVDLKLLLEMGLVEINDDILSLTAAGHRAIG